MKNTYLKNLFKKTNLKGNTEMCLKLKHQNVFST